jgi:pilus assembly protein CpaE
MRIVLADHDQVRSVALRRVLLGEGLVCEAADVVGFDSLPGRLAEVEPDLVLVACDSSTDDYLAAIRAAHQVTGVPILAAGPVTDGARIRQVMAAGVREYLDVTRLREDLSEALVRLETTFDRSNAPGKIVSIFSPNGGVGVSTIAVNLAARLAAKRPGKVSLVDLHPAPSDLSLLLDLDPKHTLDHVCRAWERLDRQMLAASMTAHNSGVHVLTQAGYPAGGGLIENHLHRPAVRQVLLLLRRMYAVSVLDLAHSFAEEQVEAMRMSNFVALVVRPDVPGLRRARWALDTASALGLSRDRFRLVLNRCGARGQVTSDKAESILGIKVFSSLPEDDAAMNRAVNQGVPVSAVASRFSLLSRSFNAFAQSV